MRYNNVTFTISLPRSRTKWLTELLKPWATTEHEPMRHCKSIGEYGRIVDDMRSQVDGPILLADTGAVFFFDQLYNRFPGAKFLIITRPVDEVIASLEAMDPDFKNSPAVHAAMEALMRLHTQWDDNRLNDGNVYGVTTSMLDDAQEVLGVIRFVCTPSISMDYVLDTMATHHVADHAALKAEVDPAVVRELFASIAPSAVRE